MYQTTGYLAAAAALTFAGTQTLASLADGEFSDLSNEVDNSTNKYAMMDLWFDMASHAMTAEGSISFYLVPSVDGTAFGTYTGNTTDAPENEQYFIGAVTSLDTTGVGDWILRNVSLPPGKWKIGVKNDLGIAFAASPGDVYWRPHSGEDSG